MRPQTPSIPSDMPHLNAGFDPEMDKYLDLDLDQNASNSSSASPDTRSKSSATQSSAGSNFGNIQSEQTFSGPSFQYGSYKQQTGLPVGGLANTFALNQATGMQYNGYGNGFMMPIETLNVPLSNLDEFDFATYPSMDIDLEADSPTDSMLYTSSSSAKAGFVNPNVLFGQDNGSSGSAAPVQRMYPGMHSELAAQAKAQQAQKQGMNGQQSRQMPSGQRPLPQNPKAQVVKDPHVEESISRLLNQMRQSSVVSADDESSTPTAGLQHLARLKKDEDDMDEDEKLLASEEGKKLSSKERRQLRNKVSARAFRSRRKEYIGQLEGEVAVKAQEANDLKVQNRQLMEENTRLTDLTRMLLSSQAFSGFLSELSGTTPPVSVNSLARPPPQSRPQSTPKDVNPHQVARQLQDQQLQIGMATIPERSVDLDLTERNVAASSWNAGVGLNNFTVYSVTSVPDGPVLDIETLSGKAGQTQPFRAHVATKCDMPTVDYPNFYTEVQRSLTHSKTAPSLSVEELDETEFSLYVEPISSSSKSSARLVGPAHHCAGPKEDKSSCDRALNVEVDEAGAGAHLERMCSQLDIVCTHIGAVTSHLS